MKQKTSARILRITLVAILIVVIAGAFVACGDKEFDSNIDNSGKKIDIALSLSEEFLDIYVGYVFKNTLEKDTYASVYVRDYSITEAQGVGGSSIIGIFQTKETTCEVYMFENEEEAQIFCAEFYPSDEDDELSVSILGGRTVTITYGTADYSAPKDVNYYQNEILTSKMPQDFTASERLSFIKKALKAMSSIEDGFVSFELYKYNDFDGVYDDEAPQTSEWFSLDNIKTSEAYDSFMYIDYDDKALSSITKELEDCGEGSYVDTTRENGFIFAELYGKDRAA